jgi:hypothetical protein
MIYDPHRRERKESIYFYASEFSIVHAFFEDPTYEL